MDLYCKRCGEPWEMDHVQHGGFSEEEKKRFWAGEGCPACFGKQVKKTPFRAQAMSVLHDILGDDIDGLAAEMEDAEYLMQDAFQDD